MYPTKVTILVVPDSSALTTINATESKISSCYL